LPYRTDKARWQSFGKGNLEKAPLGGASHPCLDKLSKNADNLVDFGKGNLEKAPLGGASHPCLDKLSKNADNLVDCSQFSNYQKWVKNQVKGVIKLIKKHVPMG